MSHKENFIRDYLPEDKSKEPIEDKALEELIAAYTEYVELLEKHISGSASFLYIHGIHTSKEDFKAGEKCRENIKLAIAGYKANQQMKEIRFSEWQLCPKCNGNGSVRVLGEYASGISDNTCDVCNGAKILTKPVVEVNQSDAVEGKALEETLKDFFNAGYDYRSSLMPESIEEFGENCQPDFKTYYSEYQIFKNKP